MAITATGLRDSIITELDNLSVSDLRIPLSVHTAWADGIREYITNNLQVSGAYTGVTDTVPPVTDPLNGTYTWNVTTYEITGTGILAAVYGMTVPITAFTAWVTAIETTIKAMTFVGEDTSAQITTSPGLTLSSFTLSLIIGDITDVETRNEAVEVIATKIYDSLISTNVATLSSDAVSTTPGTGTVQYIELT